MKVPLVLTLMFALAAPPAMGAGELDKIIACHDRAVGGGAAWSSIQSLRIRLLIREPGFEVEGTYVATRSGDMRIDILADGQRAFAEGLHRGQAWEWTPQTGRRVVGEQAAAALRHGLEMPGRFFTLQQARDHGAGVELIPAKDGAVPATWQLRVTLADGFASDLFLDPGSCRVVRSRDHRAFHPGIDPTETVIETRYSGELWVYGVLRSPASENRDVTKDAWLGTTEVRSIEHNVEIPDGYFQGQWALSPVTDARAVTGGPR